MINAILDRFGSSRRSRLTDAMSELTGFFETDTSLAKRLRRSDMRAALRGAGKSARGAALSTRSFAAANPRKVGLGIGAAAVTAIAIYAAARMYESKGVDRSDRTASKTDA